MLFPLFLLLSFGAVCEAGSFFTFAWAAVDLGFVVAVDLVEAGVREGVLKALRRESATRST